MKLCYFDAFSGISGDMTVGALLDAGAPAEALIEGLKSLGTGAIFEVEKTRRQGIAATKFRVHGGEQKAHRHLPQILKMIDGASLPPRARDRARAVFGKLAEAEARVHGVPMEKVHFHEVGAVDSIADIVGACLALELLDIGEVRSSPLNLGSGTVTADHGVLPVPAPATAILVQGRPVYSRGPEVELTTPTGAAIVAALAVESGVMPPMRIQAAGYGAGDRDFPGQANVLRAVIGERSGASEAAEILVMEANIDDSSPELLGYATERLLEAGALDVSLTAIQMKKGRPGTLLRVLAKPEDRERIASLVLAETTTLGLRMYSAERRVAERAIEEVETPFGRVRMKVAGNSAAPEYEDCREHARAAGVPLKQVIAEAHFAWMRSRQ
jgi:uncharacterized protein (TIGR00299 family) protein